MAAVMAAVCVVLANLLALRNPAQLVLARSADHSLSPLTKNVLSALTNDVRAVVLFDRQADLFEPVKNLLIEYERISPRLKLEFIDPGRDPGRAEAVQEVCSDMDGEDLLDFNARPLQKLLRKAGAEKPEAAAKAILQQRDSVGKEEEAASKPAAKEADALECPLCMERYADDDSELHVPRTLPCGHTACQGCLSLMLRTADAEAHVKKLPCPTCRVVTEVKHGKASNLQKNFSLLR